MSLPPVNPDKTASGITLDPRTQERVVPESRRPDGSVRKELKIRPGFTPQEDVSRFRGSRQQQMDRSALPKGHIFGWVAPSSSAPPKKPAAVKEGVPLSKSAKKNEKRREKKREDKERVIKDSWEDDDDDHPVSKSASPVPNNPPSKSEDSKDSADVGQDQIDALTHKLLDATIEGD